MRHGCAGLRSSIVPNSFVAGLQKDMSPANRTVRTGPTTLCRLWSRLGPNRRLATWRTRRFGVMIAAQRGGKSHASSPPEGRSWQTLSDHGKHELPIRVRYAETDRMGLLHHANYFVYFEMGRTELLRQRGLTYREIEDSGHLLVIVDIGC